jgi:hypothetical protein
MAQPKKTQKPKSGNNADEGKHEQESAEQTAERKFVEDTLIRGEAAEPDEEGKLPSDATHEVVEKHEGDLPKIRRRRFKAF